LNIFEKAFERMKSIIDFK